MNEAGREGFDHQVQIQGSKETSKAAKRESCDYGKREFKRELSLAPWTGIPSPVWEEISQGNKNRNLITATNDRMLLKNQTTKAENVDRELMLSYFPGESETSILVENSQVLLMGNHAPES
ncbi:UNVERIFIED_CONTAM: hypothetical protein Slati_1273700 [Sesamum latifolium]|uniref:Uncharacterized protein n=1 Tax=Sesamum latifolium TaxID=2727402 RepID=A0AAW2XJE5_9LAMI